MIKTMKINKDLLPMKGHFFLFNAGTAPLVPYLSTYARQLGFSSSTVGLIYMVLPITGLIAKPVFGAIADRWRLQKVLLLLFQIVTAFSFLAIYFIPESQNNGSVYVDCKNNATVLRSCYADETFINHCKISGLQTKNTTFCSALCSNQSLIQECNGIDNCEFDSLYNERLSFTGYLSLSSLEAINECIFITPQEVHSSGELIDLSCNNDAGYPSCYLSCDNSELNEMFQSAAESHIESNEFTQQFWWFFMLMIISWIGQAVVVSIADALCFNILGNKPSHYGRQRLWGSVGWGIFSLLTGTLIDVLSEGAHKDYTVAFVLMFIFMTCDFVASFFIKDKPVNSSTSILADVGGLLCSLRMIVFLLWTIAVGFCTAMVWQFLFWHIEDVSNLRCDGADYVKTLQGLVSAIQSFGGEIPFMFLSGKILKKIGHSTMMSIVLLAFGVRFILYSLLTNPWWILPIEMLQGVTFGMFYPTMTSYASVMAPEGTEATVQGLIGAVFEGIGTSLGSFIGGRIYGIYGGWNTFRWFGCGALVCCVLHFLVQLIIKRKYGDENPLKGLTSDDKDLRIPALTAQ